MWSPLLIFLFAHSMGSPLWLLFVWSWNFYKCQIFDGVPPVVAIWLVVKFLQVSDFRWGPPCGCSFSGLEIFSSVRFSMGSPLWFLILWSWNFYKCQIFDGVPPAVARSLVVIFLQVFDPVATVALPILDSWDNPFLACFENFAKIVIFDPRFYRNQHKFKNRKMYMSKPGILIASKMAILPPLLWQRPLLRKGAL